MEIFKAAANQTLDASMSTSAQRQIDSRPIEHSDVKVNADKNGKSKDANELDGLSNEDLARKTREVTDRLNYQMQQLDTNVRFAYNEKLNLMVVQVKDAKTGEEITQLPSKEAIKISEYFKESIGILFDKES
ncbi:FlaG family protein [Campylobacter concisus]|jgi:flagellar protein flaG|uniref:Flagellar biosynthesis protein FlaG n=2 Tax=Campylobacter concisus TaxID=199 RepID=A0A1Y5MGG6_9BACT|nr:FlaG family protein [Campylobacter concisus]EAT97801.1 flagellar protein FlaG [Campylobacter concisus 13826]EIF06426.1 Putative flagellar protein [Campylobacter concisus UNSWCD]MBF0902098.1 flagellar protein FlaG [Campylobacter concisus]MBF0923207.1 flagellar protein FlaG [Campylobacter concisus]MBF0928204.1 flagellar protein FlaG [Campylobacter concisus]